MSRLRYFTKARLDALKFFHSGERDPRNFPSKKMISVMLDEGRIVRTCEGSNYLQQIALSPKGRADLFTRGKTGHDETMPLMLKNKADRIALQFARSSALRATDEVVRTLKDELYVARRKE